MLRFKLESMLHTKTASAHSALMQGNRNKDRAVLNNLTCQHCFQNIHLGGKLTAYANAKVVICSYCFVQIKLLLVNTGQETRAKFLIRQ
jgi:hypothetical protein